MTETKRKAGLSGGIQGEERAQLRSQLAGLSVSTVVVVATSWLACVAPAYKQAEPDRSNGNEPASRKDNPAQIDWVAIPDGGFLAGSGPGARQEVVIKSFGLARTETTVAQYTRCVAAGACSVPMRCGGSRDLPEWRTYGQVGKEAHPVNCVTWYQARDFCMWTGGRLATQAEWEYAATGTDGRRFPWGNQSVESLPRAVCNFADASYWAEMVRVEGLGDGNQNYDDGFAATAPVGSFPLGRSPFALDDMAGNVWEWVADRHVSHDSSTEAAKHSETRVVKGGGFVGTETRWLEAASAFARDPSYAFAVVGIRCAKSIP